jgi:autotransporter-associated beta strand protein
LNGSGSNGNTYWSNNIVVPGGIELDLDAVGGGSIAQATVLGLFGNISGGGSIYKTGGGLVTFGGDNSGYTGLVNIGGGSGALAFASPTAGSANALWNFVVSGQTIQARLGTAGGIIQLGQLTGSMLMNKNTDAGNVVFEIGGRHNDSFYSGVIAAAASGGTLGINKVGTGTLTLSGANTYNGPTTISNGVLVVDTESRLGANPATFTANQLTLDGGALSNTVSLAMNSSNRGITLGTGSGLGGKFNVATGTILSLSNVITGGGNLSLNTGGTLLLTAINTYTGKTILNAGTLVIGDETGLGSNPGGFTADQLTLNGGTLSNAVALTIDDAPAG